MGRTKHAAPKPRRFRPGTVALREIRRYQRSTETLLPRIAFERVVRELTQSLGDIRYQSDALEALQAAGENYLIDLFIAADRCRVHASRETIVKDDLNLAQSMIPITNHSLE